MRKILVILVIGLIAVLALSTVPASAQGELEVTKDYRFTNVSFEIDNDNDGLLSEDPPEVAIDNDLDGLFDEDAPEPVIDNDLDGLTDEDPPEAAIDNDADGLIDEDPVDQIDNDMDGLIDEDPSEQVDNDLDGLLNEDPSEQVDNDGDGLLNEDPSEQVDNDGDGLLNEDPSECPDGSSAGTLLPDADLDSFFDLTVTLNKSGKILNCNPGQYYAVTTVTVLTAPDDGILTIKEDISNCDMSVLNPLTGGGCVQLVKQVDDMFVLISCAKSPNVTMNSDEVIVTISNVQAGDTYLLYLKFAPAVKGLLLPQGPDVNTSTVSAVFGEVQVDVSAQATLELVEK